tara:strand:- start:278 stop:625 length:348 start_codon:yes stop_codon:yes gene_type:complete
MTLQNETVVKLNKKHDISVSHTGGGCYHFEMRGHNPEKESHWLINERTEDLNFVLENMKPDTFCHFGYQDLDNDHGYYFEAQYQTGVEMIAQFGSLIVKMLKEQEQFEKAGGKLW